MESAALDGAAEAWVLCDAACDSAFVDALLAFLKEPEAVLECVGVMGDDVSLMGEVGESRSLEPLESFVRFFLRNPRVGIKAAVVECCRALARLGCRRRTLQ